jgi:hypothetical protein
MRTFEQAYPLLNRFLHSTARPAMTLSLSLARSAGAERRGARGVRRVPKARRREQQQPGSARRRPHTSQALAGRKKLMQPDR